MWKEDLQYLTNAVLEIGKRLGLNINTGKTKTMSVGNYLLDKILIENESIEDVQEFVYLGGKISKTPKDSDDANDSKDFKVSRARVRNYPTDS